MMKYSCKFVRLGAKSIYVQGSESRRGYCGGGQLHSQDPRFAYCRYFSAGIRYYALGFRIVCTS